VRDQVFSSSSRLFETAIDVRGSSFE